MGIVHLCRQPNPEAENIHNLNNQLVPRGKTQLMNVVNDVFKLTTKVNSSAQRALLTC